MTQDTKDWISIVALLLLTLAALALCNLAHGGERLVELHLRAPACAAPEGHLRPPYPLPTGCMCSPWKCWLTPGEASTAQDITGDIGDGLHDWRLLVSQDTALAARDLPGYLAMSRKEYAATAPQAAWTVEVKGPSCKDFAGLASNAACKIQLSKKQKDDVVQGSPEMPGGFSGVAPDLKEATK
jgi:hypothetical protein